MRLPGVSQNLCCDDGNATTLLRDMEMGPNRFEIKVENAGATQKLWIETKLTCKLEGLGHCYVIFLSV